MPVSVKLNSRDLKSAINKRISTPIRALASNSALLDEINLIAIKIIEPYVPYKKGKLNDSVHLAHHARSTQIVYTATSKGFDYAKYQHDKVFKKRTRNVHPKAKSFWTNVIDPASGYKGYDKLVRLATPLVKKEVRKNK